MTSHDITSHHITEAWRCIGSRGFEPSALPAPLPPVAVFVGVVMGVVMLRKAASGPSPASDAPSAEPNDVARAYLCGTNKPAK